MAHPRNSYNSEWRRKKWNSIPLEKRTQWDIEMRDLIRKHRVVTVAQLTRLMSLKEWYILQLLTPLISHHKVRVLGEDEKGIPKKVEHWEEEACNVVAFGDK